jgi:hypothetical protein
MSTDMASIHADAQSKIKDIVLAEWKQHEPFRGFVTMIQGCDFVLRKSSFIRESMKVEGWRFMVWSESSGTRIPIENERVLDSCIQRMLEELDSQPTALVDSHKFCKFDNDSPIFNKKQRTSAESLFASASKAKPSNQLGINQKWERRILKRNFPSEEHDVSCEVMRDSVTVEPKFSIATEGNVKRLY